MVALGAAANEDILVDLAGDYAVLHLSTHGYYLDPGTGNNYHRVTSNSTGPVSPLLMSGLLLAGANLHGQGCSENQIADGILTAYEVSTLNLSKTELVVLSACETGLGQVEQGEGVHGLRRAFQMAGVKTVVSALWTLPNEATSELVGSLYNPGKASMARRLQLAQQAALQARRSQGESDHPYYWGGLVVTGN